LLPLKLFSFAVEARDGKLHEIIPPSREVIKEFQAVSALLGDDDDVHILDLVTAHFIARLRTNAFETMITVWVLGLEGREWLGAEEANFFARFNYRSDPTRNKSEYLKRMEVQFKELLKPWKNSGTELEDTGP
jgi:hypothetical protein